MVAQWIHSNARPLRRLSPKALFLLAIVADRRTRFAVERELDCRFYDRSSGEPVGGFQRQDLVACKRPRNPKYR